MKAYMEARSLTQEFMDDFLGYYISPQNRYMNSLLIGPGLPGGMMGSLMADLEKNVESLNKWLQKRDLESMDQEQLLIRLFDEVEHVWPKMGYPPLVTPYSQYVKNTALMNVLQMIKGKERWSMVDENTWNMLIGKAGKLPGPLGDDILELANKQNREFFYGNPQELYPDELELFAGKMDEKGWDYGEDDEELMEYAMHPQQYEDYKSGKAKERFLEDLEHRKNAKKTAVATPMSPAASTTPKQMRVSVNGEIFEVGIEYSDEDQSTPTPTPALASSTSSLVGEPVLAPLEGKFFLTKDNSEKGIQVGDQIQSGETIGYIEAMKVYNAVAADKSGTIVEILAKPGEEVEEDDVLIKIK